MAAFGPYLRYVAEITIVAYADRAMSMSVKFAGLLTIAPAPGTQPPEGTNGCQYGLANRLDTVSATAENSSSTGYVDSPSSFIDLAIDADMRGRLFQFMSRAAAGPIDIRVTSLVSGAQEVSQVQGLFVLERPAADAITVVEVQGSGQFQWILTGSRA